MPQAAEKVRLQYEEPCDVAARDCHLVEGGSGFRGRPSTFPCVGGPAACRGVLHVVIVGEDYCTSPVSLHGTSERGSLFLKQGDVPRPLSCVGCSSHGCMKSASKVSKFQRGFQQRLLWWTLAVVYRGTIRLEIDHEPHLYVPHPITARSAPLAVTFGFMVTCSCRSCIIYVRGALGRRTHFYVWMVISQRFGVSGSLPFSLRVNPCSPSPARVGLLLLPPGVAAVCVLRLSTACMFECHLFPGK